jgi:hypothetical protein
MSELTGIEYRQADDVFALQRWVEIRDDMVYLLDPASGERLNPDRPPVWLASDPRLAEGYQALGDPVHEHELLIALGRHKLASDLGSFENRFAWFERTYAKSHAAAFEEAEGWNPAAWENTVRSLRARERLPQGLIHSKRFSDRLLRVTLRNDHVAEFSYDIEKTKKPIDRLLLEMINPEAPNSRLRQMDFPMQKVLQFAAGALREWYIPGKYMYELLKLNMPSSPRVIFTIGAAHKDVPRKFNALGFSPTVRQLPLSKKDKEQVELYGRAMRMGGIGLQALGGLSLS